MFGFHKEKEHDSMEKPQQQKNTMSDVSNDPLVAKVKQALAEKGSEIKGADIFVSNMDGKIVLKGVVDSAQEKEKALEIARNVQGVQSVSDEFRIMSDQDQSDAGGEPRKAFDVENEDQGCSPSSRVG